ncbi:MAG: O-antigen ligase family protein [Lachnotalea sp.]
MNKHIPVKIKKNKKAPMNDLLIPIILTLAVIPFILYLKKYDSGLEQYNWYSSKGEISDFYAYYRSKVFAILSFCSGIILLFRLGLYKDKIRDLRIFCGLLLFCMGVTISTAFSVNFDFSVKGTYYSFETLFVLYGYIIMCIYSYQMIQSKKDIQVLLNIMTVVVLFVIAWGVLEIYGISPMEQEWFQKLIISKENSTTIGKLINIFKNTVVVTFFNPDYTGEYLSMLVPVFLIMIFVHEKRLLKLFYTAITIALLILLWFTHYRGGIISLGATALILLPIFVKRMKKVYIIIISILALIMVGDVAFNFGVVSKIKDKQQNYSMNSIQIQEDGIHLESVKNTSIIITIENNEMKISEETGKDITHQYNEKLENLNIDGFENVTLQVLLDKYKANIIIEFDNTYWEFKYDEDKGYAYINDVLKEDTILTPKVFGNSQYDYLGSGRFYIWSRIIPMLNDYIVKGSGPNTFFVVFPQNDYVGKYHTYLTNAIIVDKAHNNYLMMWIQYGLLALIGYLVFYVNYFVKNYRFFYKNGLKNSDARIGFAFFAGTIVYMINGLFIDSSIFVSPVFWIMLGISMAELCMADGNETFYRNTLRISGVNDEKRNSKEKISITTCRNTCSRADTIKLCICRRDK